ncbi:hypothetical protein BBJ28_00007020 [Nothophytophthora sp. Chile5]|nr:hypothetical protein BBJ28_00007020 [Nothophytophthora sp. Chile5]
MAASMQAAAPTASASLYPAIEPFSTGMLEVSPVHTLYFEECGNPKGKPVLIVHGGPGSGCSEGMRRYHDPQAYRIVLLDQRGAGRSIPHASLEDNTCVSPAVVVLIVEMTLTVIDSYLLVALAVRGTCLTCCVTVVQGIAYAITHPTRVLELIMRGIFLLRKQEIDFTYKVRETPSRKLWAAHSVQLTTICLRHFQHGTNFLYPDRWEAFRDAIPEDERHDFVAAYHKRLTSEDPAVRVSAAIAWATWERTISNLIPPVSVRVIAASDVATYWPAPCIIHIMADVAYLQADAAEKVATDTKSTEAFAQIENHYLFNKGFLPSDDFLLANVPKIRHIPTVIVQGRYDVVGPMHTAWELHKALPEADFRVVQTAGHSGMEPATVQELVDATNRFKAL